MRFSVEPWAPDYGASFDVAMPDDAEPTAQVEPGIEVRVEDWAPVAARGVAPAAIAFVDGVNRIDAQVWIEDAGGAPVPGLCATYAAGAVHCDGVARVGDVRVRRGLFTRSGTAQPIGTGPATYDVRPSTGEIDQLGIAVVERMRMLEAEVAREVSAPLVVLDGLLWGRTDIANAIGYVKSHRTPYLLPDLHAVVERLAPGERTPIFLVTTVWSRFSWYLRLPGATGHPWAGVVRCEASPDLAPAGAAALADATAAALPRFASAPHKDPRAPQNLYPIAGLERELRRRSGDRDLLYRSLSLSAARPAAPA